MKNIWSIICQRSSIDEKSNLLSLFNCIEQMSLLIDKEQLSKNKKNVIPVDFQLVSLWTIEDPSKENITEIKNEFVDPDNKVLNTFYNKFKIKRGALRFRNRTNIQGLPITKEGRYYYRIWQKKKNKFELISELPLDINISYKT